MKRRAIVHDLGSGITCIDDAGESVCYVVRGTEKAAVIDTATGMENLLAIVREITDLPLLVVNTHGHCDHVWGNCFFEEAYIHPKDIALHDAHFAMRAATPLEQAMSAGATAEEHKTFVEGKPCKLHPIEEGEVLNLGGRTLTVVAIPGHTQGSIALWDDETGLLFSGDALNSQEWMQLEESTSLKDYLFSLHRLDAWKGKLTGLHTGHNVPVVETGFIDELTQAVTDILAANGAGDEDFTDWFGPACKRHWLPKTYGWILYTPDKL